MTTFAASTSCAPSTPALARVEDHRLLTGRGQFVHDLYFDGMLHAVFVRSTHGHARVTAVDLQAAKDCEGVVAVITGQQLAAYRMPPINPLLPVARLPDIPLLALDRVDALGQPIALVLASSRAAAQHASEQVLVDYDPLPAVPDLQAKGDPLCQARHRSGQAPATAPAHRVAVFHQQPRVCAMAMEPRAALARWDATLGQLTVWLGTQAPSRARADFARSFGLPPEQVRVIAPDVGGAFGAKASVSPEELVVAYAAWQLKATVKWTASRSEEFISAPHGRGARLEGELWLDADGRFAHLQARMRFPLGAWLPYSAVVPARNAARILPGPYRVGSIDIEARGDMANTAAVNIYRGAGRPEAALLMERLVELGARRCGIDPVELRLRNLVPTEAMPYATPTGEQFDAGDYRQALERACARFGYTQQRQLQKQRRAAGELVGIGIAMYVEPCGQGWESARVSLLPEGSVRVASGSAAQGQGHETSYAAIAAKELGCGRDQVQVVHGDTLQCPEGIGAMASRSMAIGGSAVAQAARMAAERRAAGEALPIVVDTVYTAPAEGWSYGCVIARMAIDRDTGQPRVEQVVWVDDCGLVVSPQLAHGQLLGGLAQGLGQSLLERIVYDDEGQVLTGSLMDYAIARADDMPPVELESMAMATRANLLGAKGVGEAGCIGVPAALLNAAADALAPLGECALDFPLTAERLWRAIQSPTSTS